jgi:hypothetical protein
MKAPRILDKIIEVVLAYRPKAKVKPPKKRSKKAKSQAEDPKDKRESTT